MRENSDVPPGEKVEHSVMDPLNRRTQFIDPIAEIIGNWPAQFVSSRLKLGNVQQTFPLCLVRNAL
jgi:hypothetical protein